MYINCAQYFVIVHEQRLFTKNIQLKPEETISQHHTIMRCDTLAASLLLSYYHDTLSNVFKLNTSRVFCEAIDTRTRLLRTELESVVPTLLRRRHYCAKCDG